MRHESDQNRLLIATFIVTTAIAIFLADPSHKVGSGNSWALAVATLGAGLITSAALSFLYVILKGYELRYKDSSERNFFDKHNYRLYNWSIKCYPVVIGFLGYILTFNYLDQTQSIDDLWSTLFARVGMLAFIFLIFRGIIRDMWSDLKSAYLFVHKKMGNSA